MAAITFRLIPYGNKERGGGSTPYLFFKLYDFSCSEHLFYAGHIGTCLFSKDFVAFLIEDPHFLHALIGSVNI